MPIITVEMNPGRSEDQKQRLAEAMTDAMVKIAGSKKDGVYVVFKEIARSNWAQDGILYSRK